MSYGYLTLTNGFTVEAWAKRTVTPANDEAMVFQGTQAATGGSGTQGQQFFFGWDGPGGAFAVAFAQESGTNTFLADPSPSGYSNDSEWHHWAVRMASDKKTWQVFMDGLPLYSGVLGTALTWNPGVLTVGGITNPGRGIYGMSLYSGSLAYVACFNKALTDSRIWEHYAAGNGGAVYYGDTEVQRLNRIWDWADVPQQSRQLDAAVTTVQGIQVSGANALDESHKAAGAGLGIVFADGQSRMVYQSRRHRYNRFVAAVLAESTQSAPGVDFEFSVDDTWVFNDVRGSRPYGATVRIQNAESRTEFGRKVYSFELPITSAEELRNATNWFANRYGDNRPRISGVTINAIGSSIIEFVSTGGVQIGDVITLAELAGNAPQDTMTWTVERIELAEGNFKDRVWKVKLELSPYELNRVTQIGASTVGDGSFIAF